MTPLRLIAIGSVNQGVMEYLTLVLPDSTGLPCVRAPWVINYTQAYLNERGQYHSTRLLDMIERQADGARASGPCLGVTELDLAVPILTFLFGEARLQGRCAVVSAHRLRQPFYGLPCNSSLLLHRVEKESLHELGHLAGLRHCRLSSCVMAFSTSVEHVDLKEAAFCDRCLPVFEAWARGWRNRP
jgi:archaemetzincin